MKKCRGKHAILPPSLPKESYNYLQATSQVWIETTSSHMDAGFNGASSFGQVSVAACEH